MKIDNPAIQPLENNPVNTAGTSTAAFGNNHINRTEPQVDRIEISSAGRQLAGSVDNRADPAVVQSTEQARKVQMDIAKEITQQPTQALAAQANASSNAIAAALG